MTREKLKNKKGIISLGITLLLGGIIIEIAVGIAIITYILNENNFGIKLSNQAFVAAESGIEEGLLRVIRDDFSAGSIITIPLSNASASVIICEDSTGNSEDDCDNGSAATGKTEIISVGTSLLRQRKIVSVLSVNSNTKQIAIESIKEESF